MDKLKIDNFLKTYSGVDFPRYISLDAAEAKKIRFMIAEKLKLDNCSDSLALVKKVDSLGESWKGTSAEEKSFSISQILSSAGLNKPEYVYVNWYRYDDIDKLTLNDFDKYFDDIWYPDADDIDVFDDSVTWILSVAHSGHIKLLKLEQRRGQAFAVTTI